MCIRDSNQPFNSFGDRKKALESVQYNIKSRPYLRDCGMLECTIRRENSGFAGMYPQYTLLLSGSYRYLLTAKKISIVGSSHYVITRSTKDFSRSNPECLGKLRSNKAQNEYSLFDTGENPNSKASPEHIRAQLGAILFVTLLRYMRT
eukprot:TRINITY_DN3370_c0_g9_i2.p1 TRINITY_DN3370_c0_g9~~TRINITY_DN3370_c0_g9_i2.p1  ORF type:complete len:148 (-),score=10.19 TRINITY_DN3370_c0_g9_i2:516-959(-)